MAEETELTVPVNEQDHTLGPATAPVALVMYGDYECPYTALANQFVAELREELGEQLRLVYRHFPLADVHPDAERAAEAAEAAAAQGRFWEMHDALFEQQASLRERDLVRYAAALGLDRDRFSQDLNQHAGAERVSEDARGGRESGVHGTPTFFINGRRQRAKFDLPGLRGEIIGAVGEGGKGGEGSIGRDHDGRVRCDHPPVVE
jgi:protein-disulfide isomerase